MNFPWRLRRLLFVLSSKQRHTRSPPLCRANFYCPFFTSEGVGQRQEAWVSRNRSPSGFIVPIHFLAQSTAEYRPSTSLHRSKIGRSAFTRLANRAMGYSACMCATKHGLQSRRKRPPRLLGESESRRRNPHCNMWATLYSPARTKRTVYSPRRTLVLRPLSHIYSLAGRIERPN